MATVTLICVLLMLLSVILIAWERFNPKWQSADAYDSLTPFYLGLGCLVIGTLLAMGAGLYWLFLRELFERF